MPQPVPSAGYLPMNPCATPTDSSAAAGRGGGGGGGGFGGGGGLGGPAPYVLPGTYTVALMSGTKVLDSKPLKIVFDPDVHFAAGEHERYNCDRQRPARDSASRRRDGDARSTRSIRRWKRRRRRLVTKSDIPANVKTQFESLNKEFDAIRKKFGVPTNAGAGRAVAAADAGARWIRRTFSRVRRR